MCVGPSQADVERHLQTYRQTNPQYVGMMEDLSTWLLGTPDQVQSQLDALAASGIDRVMISVNCDLHRDMLSLLPAAV